MASAPSMITGRAAQSAAPQCTGSVCRRVQSLQASRQEVLRNEFRGAALAINSHATAPSTSLGAVERRHLKIEAAKKVVSGRSLVLNSTLIAEEGKADQVAKVCESVLKLAEEKKKDQKAGILSFECHTDAYDKNVLHFWERFDTFVSMNDFHASPEYTEFLSEVRPLLSSPVLLAAYEYKDGKIGCMLNPIGPKGEGGLDDATGQGGSGGGASYKQTSQAVQQGVGDIGEREGWGMNRALEISSARTAAQEAAAAIAKSFRSIFGVGNKE